MGNIVYVVIIAAIITGLKMGDIVVNDVRRSIREREAKKW